METSETPLQDTLGLSEGLTREEDDELRRLHYFRQVGDLSSYEVERFIELRLRDRRGEVRPPRGFIIEERPPEPRKTGLRALFRR